MRQQIVEDHQRDAFGRPAGGRTFGVGIEIQWQDGPLGRGAERQEPNGAFVEGVISAALGRLYFYQTTEFRCHENLVAIQDLEHALEVLNRRTAERELRGVEGTHQR